MMIERTKTARDYRRTRCLRCIQAPIRTSERTPRRQPALRSPLSLHTLHEFLHFLLFLLRKPVHVLLLGRFAVRFDRRVVGVVGVVGFGGIPGRFAENFAEKPLFADLFEVFFLFVGLVAVFAFAQRGHERFLAGLSVVIVGERVVRNLVSLHLPCELRVCEHKTNDACSELLRERLFERIRFAARPFAL